MKIDAHQHFWNYDPARDTWITDDMAVLKRDFLPADLEPFLTANNMDGSVLVQVDQSIRETRSFLELAKKSELIKAVVGWIDLKAEDLEAQLEGFNNEKLLSGFRHILQAEQAGYMLDDKFVRGIQTLGKSCYTYDVLVYHNQLAEVAELLERLPAMKLILDHCGKPDIRSGDLSAWRKNLKQLSKFEHLYVKLSGLITEADWKNWTSGQITTVIRDVIQSFGPDRVLFGSDWPVCLLAGNYEQVLEVFQNGISGLSSAEQENVMGLNAVKFYDITNEK